MNKGLLLYNPHAGGKPVTDDLDALEFVMDADLKAVDITTVKDYREFFNRIDEEEFIILSGGDGTLNRFINATDGLDISQEIYYYPAGTGNDFAKEMGKTGGDNPFPVSQYFKNLPTVEVKGNCYRFLNGVGYGIDGYCCEVGDELRKVPGKKVNYTAIAIRGLLMDYAPTSAVVTVDGVRHEYDDVWLAPTMYGKFYGGGMIPTPDQRRDDPEGKLSCMVFHGKSKLKTLCIFPAIFKGEHVRHTGSVEVLSGHEITVEFSAPRPLQVDGETILNVRSYTAKSASLQRCRERKESQKAPLLV